MDWEDGIFKAIAVLGLCALIKYMGVVPLLMAFLMPTVEHM